MGTDVLTGPREGSSGWTFPVAGLDPASGEYTGPVAVTCRAGHRYDSGGDPADLAALVTWAANHRVCGPSR